MKKLVAVVVMLLFVAAPVLAADVVTIKAKMGDITFNHKAHGEKNACKACHGEGTPAKLTLGKDKAHTMCGGCHDEKKAGPAKNKCMECHKKK